MIIMQVAILINTIFRFQQQSVVATDGATEKEEFSVLQSILFSEFKLGLNVLNLSQYFTVSLFISKSKRFYTRSDDIPRSNIGNISIPFDSIVNFNFVIIIDNCISSWIFLRQMFVIACIINVTLVESWQYIFIDLFNNQCLSQLSMYYNWLTVFVIICQLAPIKPTRLIITIRLYQQLF